jgi:hypothetical protein
MIDAVVIGTGSVEGLARTLADLVAGAVDGVVKRVTVAAPMGAEEALFEVADDAGATFRRLPGSYGERAAAAVAAAGGDWLMLLEAGARLRVDWHRPVAAHLNRRPDQPAAFLREKAGFLRPQPVLALVVPRALYAEAGGFAAADEGLRPLLKRLERSGRAARL